MLSDEQIPLRGKAMSVTQLSASSAKFLFA